MSDSVVRLSDRLVVRRIAATLAGAAVGAIFVMLISAARTVQNQPLSTLEFVLFLITAAFVGGVLTFVTCRDSQRRFLANRDYAARLNLEFIEKPACLDWPTSLVEKVPGGNGAARKIRWSQQWHGVFHGRLLDVVDVRYTVYTSNTDGGSSLTWYEHTLYVWSIEQKSFPQLSIQRRTWTDNFGSFWGTPIIEFDSSKLSGPEAEVVREFSRRFTVFAGSDAQQEALVRTLCVSYVLREILKLGTPRIVFDGGRIAIWWPDTLDAGSRRQENIERMLRLLKSLEGAIDDPAPTIIAPAVRDRSEVVPFGCAFAAAATGFFAGQLGVLVYVIFGKSALPQIPWLLISFASTFGFAGAGWLVGTALMRYLGRNSRSESLLSETHQKR